MNEQLLELVAWRLASHGHRPQLAVQIPGEPVGKGRPQFAKRGDFVTTRTPDKTAAWERRAEVVFNEAWSARPPMPRAGFELVVLIEALHSRPKDLLPRPASPRARKPQPPAHRLPCGRKPDIDNVAKIVLDAMVLARVLEDDVAVSAVLATKAYAALDEGPGVHVRLYALEVSP